MNRLRQAIVGNGLKIKHVAKVANIERNRFGRIVRSVDLPDVDEAIRIVAALRECTGKEWAIDELWPVPAPEEAA